MSEVSYVGLGRFGRGHSSRLPVIGHLGDSGSGLTPPDQMELSAVTELWSATISTSQIQLTTYLNEAPVAFVAALENSG